MVHFTKEARFPFVYHGLAKKIDHVELQESFRLDEEVKIAFLIYLCHIVLICCFGGNLDFINIGIILPARFFFSEIGIVTKRVIL